MVWPSLVALGGLVKQRLQLAALVHAHQDVAASHKLPIDEDLHAPATIPTDPGGLREARNIAASCYTEPGQCAQNLLLTCVNCSLVMWAARLISKQITHAWTMLPSTVWQVLLTCGMVGHCVNALIPSRMSASAKTFLVPYCAPAHHKDTLAYRDHCLFLVHSHAKAPLWEQP